MHPMHLLFVVPSPFFHSLPPTPPSSTGKRFVIHADSNLYSDFLCLTSVCSLSVSLCPDSMTTTVETATPTRSGLAPGELSLSPNSALLGTPKLATTSSERPRLLRSRVDRGHGRVKGGSVWLTRVSVYGMLAFIALLSADVEHLFMYHYDYLSHLPPSIIPVSSQLQSPSSTTASTHRSLHVSAYDNGYRRSGHEQEHVQEHGFYGVDARQRLKWPAHLQRRRKNLARDQELGTERQTERDRRQRRGLGLMPSIFCHATPSPGSLEDLKITLGEAPPKPAPVQVIEVKVDPLLLKVETMRKELALKRSLPGYRSDHDRSISEDEEEDEQGFAYLGEIADTHQQQEDEDIYSSRQYSQPMFNEGNFYQYDQKARSVLGFDVEDALSAKQTVFSPVDMASSGALSRPRYPSVSAETTSQLPLSQRRFLMVDMKLEEGISEVRTALEYAVYAARLTERTLVLPPFLYFRGCVNKLLCRRSPFQETTLRPFAPTELPRKDSTASTRKLQPRHAIPFERIYDIPRLREYIDVIPMEDWVQFMIRQEEQDMGRARVDFTATSGLQWLKDKRHFDFSSGYHQELLDQFFEPSVQPSLTLKVNVQQYLYREEPFVVNANPQRFDGQPRMIYGHDKAPSRSLNGTRSWTVSKLPFSGFKETFGPENSSVASKQVLLFQGGMTSFEQQMMVFESESARADFEQVSMHWVRSSAEVRRAADQLIRNLVVKTGGRNYFAVHYRRGPEFMSAKIPRSKYSKMGMFRRGLGTMDVNGPMLRVARFLLQDTTVANFDVEDLIEDGQDIGRIEERVQEQTNAITELQAKVSNLPHEGTRERNFYLATDERDVDILQQLRDQGAIVLADLMDDPVFVEEHLDWMTFPDWFAYLDQLICAKARRFWGSPMSVFSGSIINQRIGEERRKRRRRQPTQQWEQERQRTDGSSNGWLYRPPPMEFRLQ